jgi:hypothetical protein
MRNKKLFQMNRMIILLLLYCCQPVLAQSDKGEYVKTDKIKGYIFPGTQAVDKYIYEEATSRFTPTRQEVMKAEALINQELKGVSDSAAFKDADIGFIYKNLNGYIRQYVGFINASGAKVIWVNFMRTGRGWEEKLDKYVIEVSDGGAGYWNVKVNLPENSVIQLRINCRG